MQLDDIYEMAVILPSDHAGEEIEQLEEAAARHPEAPSEDCHNIRADRLHRISHSVSKNHALIVLEDLGITTMSASAKGTVEKPGKQVKLKARLNRVILDQGWGALRRQIQYKQIWNGGMLILILMNPAHTSQECSVCGHILRENRPSRELFYCTKCGHTENADENAAKVILSRVGHTRLVCGSNGASSP